MKKADNPVPIECPECENFTLLNPWPNTEVKEIECPKCHTIISIEWVADKVYLVNA